LEHHYGLLMALAIIAIKSARKSRDTQLYCLGASLIVLVYLVQR
jgi:t-SNARE complex subunit (syntaxin)